LPDAESDRPLGRVLSAAQFWASMQRWGVEDAAALQLIGYPGRIGISGKRPRFRFTTRQARISGLLAELDGALEAAGKPPAWLHRTQRGAVRRTDAAGADAGGAGRRRRGAPPPASRCAGGVAESQWY